MELHDVVMPQFGETSDEDVTIVDWSKRVGDSIQAGEMLLEIETAKSSMSVEATVHGTVHQLLFEPGAAVKPGEVIARISVTGAR